MNLQLDRYVEQVRSYCPIFEKRVGGATDWAVASLPSIEAPDYPAAYVVLENEQGGEFSLDTEYEQMVDVSIAVIALVGNPDPEERRGQTALAQIDEVRTQLFQALLMWTPSNDTIEPLGFDGAEVIHLDPERLAYRFDFKTRYRLALEDTFQAIQYRQYPDLTEVDSDVGGINQHLNFDEVKR